MNRYIIKYDIENHIDVTYGDDGFISQMIVTGGLPPEFWRDLWRAGVLRDLSELNIDASLMNRISSVPLDLSFERFWDEYGHKVGNKPRCKRLWDGMLLAEKVDALKGVMRYKRQLQVSTWLEQAYPETWLSQRRWAN